MMILLVLFFVLCESAITQGLSTETSYEKELVQNEHRGDYFTERDTIPKETGQACGSLSWSIDPETSIFTISGTGAMSCCWESHSPWSEFNEQVKTIVIEEGVSSICDYAFYNFTYLTTVNIKSNVSSIGDSAFQNCYNLTTIAIPSSVSSIGDGVFCGCKSLSSITISCDVPSIGAYMFYLCSSLKTVNIESNLTTIGKYAFFECKSLSSITIPSSVSSIGHSAFYGCESLSSITIPSNVTSIDEYAFQGCTSLKTITIPSSVSSIGSRAFNQCGNLRSVVYQGSNDPLESSATEVFSGCQQLKFVCVPSSYIDASFCQLNEFCKHEACKSFLNNQCFEDPDCSDGKTITMKKRENATAWERKSNECYKYQCHNDSGAIYWKYCNSSDEIERVCENDQCKVIDSDKEKDNHVVEINVEGIYVIDLNMAGFRRIISNLTNIKEDELRIRVDVNDKDEIVKIFVIVGDENSAEIIKDKLNELDC